MFIVLQEIGLAAGELWHYLESNGPCTIGEMKKALQIKDNDLLMAVGWLAREGKLSFEAEGKALRISLSQ
ncbi:MAG: winged helix-turn-helix domain-containing protein [Acidobacteria bacterium]|nr:winged helix-turn-helix domain-containing protein [Acidobacteriota bacterium]